jgi:hypothetical protein
MYSKFKRSMAKFIFMMGVAAVIGMLGLSPAQASDTTSTTTVTATPDILNAGAKFIGKSKKVAACRAFAEKIERNAPPRDPSAECKGTLRVLIFGVVKTPPCPSGWFGGSAKARLSFKETQKARSFAKTIARGRASALATTLIKDRVKVTGEASSTCVRIPPPVVEYDKCPDIPGNQPADYVCNPTPPPPPPPTETYAPTMDASAGVCVAPGGTSGVINVTGTNKDNVTRTLIFTAPGKAPVEKTVSAGSTESVSFSGFAPGSYTVKVEVKETGKFATKTVTVIQCETPVYNCPPGTTWTDIDKDGIREEGECFGPPTFTQFREFNDLYHSLPGMPTTMDHFVTVDTPAGHSYTITWEAVWGSFATPTKTGQDGVQVSSTYTAPSEVPPAHPDMGLAAGYDKITVTVVDNVTGQRVVRSTAPFRIKAWPSD